jgi:hypothetical protein
MLTEITPGLALNVALGPAAGAALPAASTAVAPAIDMPSVPVPVTFSSVTVRELAPVPDTEIPALAVPVVINEISPPPSVTADAPVYVTVYVTGPVAVTVAEGALMLMPGGVLSTVTLADGPEPPAAFPTASLAVPD